MDSRNNISARLIQEAVEDFRQATDTSDLWARLGRRLQPFGITGTLYGAEAMPSVGQAADILLDGFVPNYVQTKLDEGVFYTDLFVQAGLSRTAPILWGDVSAFGDISPEENRSLAIDWDFKVTTGVTIPMRFAGGLGVSCIGCHAADMSWSEFDRLWGELGDTVTATVNAFDIALRRDHVGEVFPLTPNERECLLQVAAGLKQQRIADLLNLCEKQVEKRLKRARDKLKAATTTQAVANALIFGVITP